MKDNKVKQSELKGSKDLALHYMTTLVEVARESFLILDSHLRVVSANPTFYQNFQVTLEQTENILLYDLGNGQWNIPDLRRLLEEILPDKKVVKDYEVKHTFQTIGKKTILLNARQIDIDKVKMIVLAMEDITVRKELEEKLAEYTSELEVKIADRTAELEIKINELDASSASLQKAKAKDDAILASIGDGMVVVDKEGKISYVNQAFEEMIGWKMSETLGKYIVEVMPREDEKGEVVPFKERILTQVLFGEKFITDLTNLFYYIRKDKSRFPAISIIAPIVLEGKILGAVETFRDITREKEIDKAKTEFVSLASHQLRTPLSTVNWYTEMLLSGDVGKATPQQKKYLDEVYRSNQRMVVLVNALLDVSRLELGTFVVQPETTDVVKLVQSVIDEQKPRIDENKIKFLPSLENNIPLIQADPKLLRMVVQNLLSNAVKYTPESGKIRVSLSLDDKKNVLLKISDTGYGIPINQQDKIFTKLFRADNVRGKDTEGTGLGLYIVKSAVGQSGGKIWFESKENKGTTFYVAFPFEGMKKKEGTKKSLSSLDNPEE